MGFIRKAAKIGLFGLPAAFLAHDKKKKKSESKSTPSLTTEGYSSGGESKSLVTRGL